MPERGKRWSTKEKQEGRNTRSAGNWAKMSRTRLGLIAIAIFLLGGLYDGNTKSAHPVEIYFGETQKGVTRAVAPAGYDLVLNIDPGPVTQTTFGIQLKDLEGFLISSGIGYRRDRLVQIQVPAIERHGSYFVQLFDGSTQVSESVLDVEGQPPRSALKDFVRVLVPLMHAAGR